jgi:hypothetical protein
MTASNIEAVNDHEAEMLYRPSSLEPKAPSRLRDLALICALAALGIVLTLGAVWVGWEVASIFPSVG